MTISSTLSDISRYICKTCGKRFSQSQGVSRHRRAVHNKPHSCFHSNCKFKWTRPCEYRTHLQKRHPNVNPDKVLGKRAGSRCRSTIIGRDLPQPRPQHFFLDPKQWSQANVSPQRPMTSPLPELVKITHVSQPDVLLSDVTNASSVLSFPEERTQSAKDVGGKFWSVHQLLLHDF